MDNQEERNRARFTDGHDWIDEAVITFTGSPEKWQAREHTTEQNDPSPVLKKS
jgi:hypothetical protein